MRSFGLIPAAGKSSRMGRPKLALPVGDRCVLEHVVATVRAGGVGEVLVVVGPETAFLQPLAERAGAQVHVLPAETPDMRATVQAGLRVLEERFHPRDKDVWLLLPADHPTLDREIVPVLLAASLGLPDANIFVPAFQGKRGHPTLMRWRLQSAIQALPPGQALNTLIRSLTAETVELAWNTPDVLLDLDTPEDYERLRERWTV